MTREELIEALEKATGPCIMLEQEISIWRYAQEGLPAPPIPRPYTASLDAALSLVPEGWEWIVFGAGGADVWHVGNDAVLHRIDETYAATPAIALCIAALRAREASDDGR